MQQLVGSLPWFEQVSERPPVKLDYSSITVPEDLDFTFIGIRHDTDGGGKPDYLEALLPWADVLLYEVANWDNATLRRLQGVAFGKYVDLKNELAENDKDKVHNRGSAEWRECFDRGLYESGVRVRIPDYPKDHPKARSYMRVMTRASSEDPLTDERAEMYLERDKYILKRTCSDIVELRKIKDIREKSPLRVIQLFGAAHACVYQALLAAAGEQGVDFQGRLLFEASASFERSALHGITPAKLALHRDHLRDYQNWLREPG